jgi:hypothetical protein
MTQSEREYELALHLQNIHKGANWFYWIVGLSLVNVALSVFGADVHFIIGLGYAEVAAGIMLLEGEGVLIKVIGAVLALIVLSGFMFIGRKAHKPSKGWFMAGIILYGLDTLIYLYVTDILPALFHLYVLYNLVMGYRAIEPYNQALNYTTDAVFTDAEVTTVPVTDEVAVQPAIESTTIDSNSTENSATETPTNNV